MKNKKRLESGAICGGNKEKTWKWIKEAKTKKEFEKRLKIIHMDVDPAETRAPERVHIRLAPTWDLLCGGICGAARGLAESDPKGLMCNLMAFFSRDRAAP